MIGKWKEEINGKTQQEENNFNNSEKLWNQLAKQKHTKAFFRFTSKTTQKISWERPTPIDNAYSNKCSIMQTPNRAYVRVDLVNLRGCGPFLTFLGLNGNFHITIWKKDLWLCKKKIDNWENWIDLFQFSFKASINIS